MAVKNSQRLSEANVKQNYILGSKVYVDTAVDIVSITLSILGGHKVLHAEPAYKSFLKILCVSSAVQLLSAPLIYYLAPHDFQVQKLIIAIPGAFAYGAAHSMLSTALHGDSLIAKASINIFASTFVLGLRDLSVKLAHLFVYKNLNWGDEYSFSFISTFFYIVSPVFFASLFELYYNPTHKLPLMLVSSLIQGTMSYIFTPPTNDIFTHRDYAHITTMDMGVSYINLLIVGTFRRIGISMVEKIDSSFTSCCDANFLIAKKGAIFMTFSIPASVLSIYLTPIIQNKVHSNTTQSLYEKIQHLNDSEVVAVAKTILDGTEYTIFLKYDSNITCKMVQVLDKNITININNKSFLTSETAISLKIATTPILLPIPAEKAQPIQLEQLENSTISTTDEAKSAEKVQIHVNTTCSDVIADETAIERVQIFYLYCPMENFKQETAGYYCDMTHL